MLRHPPYPATAPLACRGHAACCELVLRAWVRSGGAVVRAADALVSDGVGEERYVDSHTKAGLAALHLAALAGSVECGEAGWGGARRGRRTVARGSGRQRIGWPAGWPAGPVPAHASLVCY